LKHIISGIKNTSEVGYKKNDGLVFYQFGKYLTKKNNEPIFDQHNFRAYAIYKERNKS